MSIVLLSVKTMKGGKAFCVCLVYQAFILSSVIMALCVICNDISTVTMIIVLRVNGALNVGSFFHQMSSIFKLKGL